MLILIEKDSATRVPREVTENEAAKLAVEFTVFVVTEDGSNVPYAEFVGMDDGEPDAEPEKPAKASAKPAAKKK